MAAEYQPKGLLTTHYRLNTKQETPPDASTPLPKPLNKPWLLLATLTAVLYRCSFGREQALGLGFGVVKGSESIL